MKKQQMQEEVKRTMESFDKLHRIEPNPYLATRILARWKGEQEKAQQSQGLRQWQWALIAVLLILNGFALLTKWIDFDKRTDYLNSVASDYNFNATSENSDNYSLFH